MTSSDLRTARVVCEADGYHTKDDVVEYFPFNFDTCQKIAERNGYMTPNVVHAALLEGGTIYTSFRRYRLEQIGE